MKKGMAGIASLVLPLSLIVICMAACSKSSSIFYLNGKAVNDFYIVKAEDASSSANNAAFKIRMAIEDEFDINMAYYFTTASPDAVEHKYEIIIGDTSRLNEEDYPVKKSDLGENGFFIKASGSKIYIISAAEETLIAASEYFINEFIKGKSRIELSSSYEYVQEAVFDIQNIYVNGSSLKEYKIVYDDQEAGAEAGALLNQALVMKAGIELEAEYIEDAFSVENSIILSNARLPGDGFIKFFVDGSNLVISCSTDEGIMYGAGLFIKTYIENASGSFNFPDSYVYSDISGMVVLMPEE